MLFALLPLLLAAGVFGWMIQLRQPLAVDASALVALPLNFDAWVGRDLDLDSGVEDMLDADFHVNRAYMHRFGDLVWFYLGYYGTERGGRPEHTPWECYPSNGWEIVSSQTVEVAPGIHANELVVTKDEFRRLVQFWYQSHRATGLLGGFDQAVDRFVSRIRDGRADGSLVRMSTPLGDDDDFAARARLAAFAEQMVPELALHWPSEQRSEESVSAAASPREAAAN